jgi:hypothetical protein
MTFTTPAPRSARSRTARRSASTPAVSPPIDQQCPPGEVIGGPAATTVGPAPSCRARSRTAQWWSPRSRTAVTPGAQRLLPGGGDHGVELRRVQLGHLLQGAGAGVRAEMHVAVDQPGQQRRVGDVGDRAAVGRRRGGGLDATTAGPSTSTSAPPGRKRSPSKARGARYPRMHDAPARRATPVQGGGRGRSA